MQLPIKLSALKESLEKLSGIGEKSAMRLALELLEWPVAYRSQLANSLDELKDLKQCRECFSYCDDEFCAICSDEKRMAKSSLCVVENINDLLAIERSGYYEGRYHVLGGVLNPLMGIGPEQLAIEELVERVERLQITELILAVNPSVEGDATCSYVRDRFGLNINVERIGLGLPMGGSLEYVDAMTISKAFENRRSFADDTPKTR